MCYEETPKNTNRKDRLKEAITGFRADYVGQLGRVTAMREIAENRRKSLEQSGVQVTRGDLFDLHNRMGDMKEEQLVLLREYLEAEGHVVEYENSCFEHATQLLDYTKALKDLERREQSPAQARSVEA